MDSQHFGLRPFMLSLSTDSTICSPAYICKHLEREELMCFLHLSSCTNPSLLTLLTLNEEGWEGRLGGMVMPIFRTPPGVPSATSCAHRGGCSLAEDAAPRKGPQVRKHPWHCLFHPDPNLSTPTLLPSTHHHLTPKLTLYILSQLCKSVSILFFLMFGILKSTFLKDFYCVPFHFGFGSLKWLISSLLDKSN